MSGVDGLDLGESPGAWMSERREMVIRLAVPQDVPTIMRFIHELAAYERESEAVRVTATDLHRDGFGPVPRFHVFVAEWEGVAAGFALYFYSYSTWEGHHGIHVEDLYVSPEYRGRGVGKALLSKVAGVAVVEGCSRLEWSVLEWNSPAIDFYREMGAQFRSEWKLMRVTGQALCALSERCD